jgi:hypothetical protein
MGSKRAKSNRGRFFRRRSVKTVQLEGVEEIHVINPKRSRDAAWQWVEILGESSGNQKITEATRRWAYNGSKYP